MSAVAEIPVNPTWSQRFNRMDRSQQLRLAIGISLVVALAIAAIVLGRQPEWRVLYANLSDKDGGAIVAQLSQMNIPYKHAEGGGAIFVPADRVHDVRLRLASQGLPKGSVAGFELMEANRFGMTQFQERLTFQRGLEGELTRSIQALSSVQGARVHLALPNQNGFFREQQKASASVLVTMHPGRTLDRAQIAGIVHLVASSVPEMSPTAVSVLDDSGKLLSSLADAAGGVGDAQQLQYVQQIEQQYSRRILDLLEPLVGRQNVKAQVTAEVDFSQTESTSELHKPNLAADASAVRSQQVVETRGAQGNTPPSGVPGATSNQPPGPSSAPINGANPALTAAGAAAAAGAGASSKRESVTNYEVDKTVRVVRGGSGAIKRLSAAVVVNYQSATEGAGKVVSKPLSTQQIEQMTALVRESIGFNKDRGDSVNLMNAQFLSESITTPEVPLWRRPEVVDLARSFAWPLGLVLFAALILWGLVRPAMRTLARPMSPRGQLDALVAEAPQRPALSAPAQSKEPAPATPEQLRLEDARGLAKSNPIAVANIVKNWVSGEVAA
ncbi:MAG TPA: flagellar basal-body MS-ring/collar protein FliF [Burkholderiaceae bacterium]|nr:flagellar basal-body MS-ring/collar protein FliF [Burkholderiaceae bacterium]